MIRELRVVQGRRIIQQQVRPQLGMSWGSAKNPNCEGIPVGELENVDWNQVDLSEWVDLLNLAGEMPEGPNLTPDQLTGGGSSLGNAGTRPDALQRTIERSSAIDFEEERERARRDVWGER